MMLRFDVEEGLIAAGQPNAEELRKLTDEGVETVINMRRPVWTPSRH